MLIYKIISPNTDLVYVGKTKCTLNRRLSGHLSKYKAWLAGKPVSNCSSYKVLEHGDCSIVLIEDGSREGYWIKEMNACNTMTLDYDHAACMKAYQVENKETLIEYWKGYREANQEVIREYKRAYHAANRETISEKQRAYRETNREAIREKRGEKVACDNCGTVVNRSCMARHKKSGRCQ